MGLKSNPQYSIYGEKKFEDNNYYSIELVSMVECKNLFLNSKDNNVEMSCDDFDKFYNLVIKNVEDGCVGMISNYGYDADEITVGYRSLPYLKEKANAKKQLYINKYIAFFIAKYIKKLYNQIV